MLNKHHVILVKIYTQNQFTIQYFLQIRFYLLK